VYGDSIPLYPELFVSENCSAAFRGVRITYVQVYKSNTQGICGNLLRLHDGSDRPDSPAFTFTFVRDPMAHFVSGFSEISYHARRSQRAFDREPFRGKPGVPHCRQFSQRNASAQQQATAFVGDFVFGRLGPRCRHLPESRGYFWELDLHAFPQVAFVRSALAYRHIRGVDFVGRLEELEAHRPPLRTAPLLPDSRHLTRIFVARTRPTGGAWARCSPGGRRTRRASGWGGSSRTQSRSATACACARYSSSRAPSRRCFSLLPVTSPSPFRKAFFESKGPDATRQISHRESNAASGTRIELRLAR